MRPLPAPSPLNTPKPEKSSFVLRRSRPASLVCRPLLSEQNSLASSFAARRIAAPWTSTPSPAPVGALGWAFYREPKQKRQSTEGAMLGLMQDWPLLIHRIIDHAAAQHG